MSVSLSISASSRQYLYVPNVRAFAPGTEAQITGLQVEFAFTPITRTDKAPATWILGSWSPGAETPTARILIGITPGGVVLTKGAYDVWIRITGTTERPVQNVGPVTITT